MVRSALNPTREACDKVAPVQLPLLMEGMVLPLKKRTAAAREAADFTITFDGGALGNPGKGYGSYHIVGPNGYEARERLDYGDRVTNNQAEYRTLIAALNRLQRDHAALQRRGHVAIHGDSQLVVNQVNGEWKVKHPDLAPLYRQAVTLLQAFHSVDVGWHRRHESVRILGH